METSEIKREIQAELVEVGGLKSSGKWNNLYVKFKLANGTLHWFYYSEHENKPYLLQEIPGYFGNSPKYKIGDKMDIAYKIKQAPNKTTILMISHTANHRPKK